MSLLVTSDILSSGTSDVEAVVKLLMATEAAASRGGGLGGGRWRSVAVTTVVSSFSRLVFLCLKPARWARAFSWWPGTIAPLYYYWLIICVLLWLIKVHFLRINQKERKQILGIRLDHRCGRIEIKCCMWARLLVVNLKFCQRFSDIRVVGGGGRGRNLLFPVTLPSVL